VKRREIGGHQPLPIAEGASRIGAAARAAGSRSRPIRPRAGWCLQQQGRVAAAANGGIDQPVGRGGAGDRPSAQTSAKKPRQNAFGQELERDQTT